MEIKIIEEGKPTVFSLVGRLDTNTSPQLEEFAGELFESGKVDLVVDMSACDFVSSAGLRVIMSAAKKVGSENIRLINVRSDVYEILHSVG